MLLLANHCLKNSAVHELAHNTNPEYKAKVHMKRNLSHSILPTSFIKFQQKGVEEIVNSSNFFILFKTFEWIIKDW